MAQRLDKVRKNQHTTLPEPQNPVRNPRTVQLRVIRNRVVSQAEQILGRGTSRFRIMEEYHWITQSVEKYLEEQKLFHSFIDFKKAFDRVWYDWHWCILKYYNIARSLYDEATSAALLNGSVGYFFQTTAAVQGCPLSLVGFNIIFEKIMQEKLTPHCHPCPLEDDRLATCGFLTISIFKEAVKNCNNSLKGCRKQLLITTWTSAPTKATSLSTAPSQGHPPIYARMEKC